MLLPSLLRTVVPMLAGWIITLLTGLGLHADSTTVAGGLTIAVAAAYYLVFRLLEWVGERLPGVALQRAAGVFLGWARPPSYLKPKALEPVGGARSLDEAQNG
ncbi:hypothetical protein ACF1AY_04960 [Streptomyces sp. NPDC014776]|uniref:hypothetical protein n=1 Tax=Streptomyces sp. NPDC014776 TaxID=3364909 RepID=UPI0036FE9C45